MDRTQGAGLFELDPRTLAALAATISAVLAALALAYGRTRRTYPGFGWWTLSLVLVSAALVSIALRDAVWAFVFDYGGTVFGVSAMLAVLRGQREFCIDPVPLGSALLGAGIGLAAMVGADLADHNALRGMLGAATTGLLSLLAAWVFARERRAGLRSAALFCAAVLGAFAMVRLWRAGYLFWAGPDFDILAASLPTAFNYVVNAFMPTLWGFGFMLLNAARLEADLDASRADLGRLAATDPLTGIRNRRAFFVEAETELRRARRYGLPVSLMMIDVDRFKQINDRFGHLAGDRLLVEIAVTLARELRTTDIYARFGGEEFVALLVHTPAADVAPTAERLRRAVAALSIDSLGSLFGTTVSIGTASVAAGEAELDELVRHADAALYRAKQAGRDRVISA